MVSSCLPILLPSLEYSGQHLVRLPYIPVDRFLKGGSLLTAKEAQSVAEEVVKVELLKTKFVSLVKADPIIHTLLPLSPRGKICDINCVCIDGSEGEFFRLITREEKFTVDRDVIRTKTQEFSPILQFEQDPIQILDALLPLYFKGPLGVSCHRACC
ncbi:hypothetical protein SAY86_004298 [Trapa natans]|uniref:F-ATPase gamma subunit n=1 Tax=Trapa natans TaxID=22666 RepID=A0AAN7RNM8_TRANT|nr:hypothetical protein SAY86_004298 [Trapa natans]